MKRRLIVPLDGSDAAEAAIAFATAIPSEQVLLFICLPDYGDLPSRLDPSIGDEQRDQARTNAETYLDRMAITFREQGRSVECVVTVGDPANAIVSIAGEGDLIVMTTHGRGAGRRAIFGSVADRVVRHTTAPVFLVRGGERPVATVPLLRFVIALDGSELAEQAIPVASELAVELDAAIYLVRALDLRGLAAAERTGTYAAARYAAASDEIRAAFRNYLTEQVVSLTEKGLRVSTAVLDGAPAETLIRVLEPGDVIAITSHGRGGITRWMLGSVAEKLVRLSPVPVLICR